MSKKKGTSIYIPRNTHAHTHISFLTFILSDRPSNTRGRRSALKARKSITAMHPHPRTNPTDLTNTLEATTKTIQSIKTHRKKRHGKLREMTRDEEDGKYVRAAWVNGGEEG